MAEASFFPIPPDVLLIPLALGSRLKAYRFALICSLFSILGAVIGYGIGYLAWWKSPGNFTAFAQLFFDHIPGFTTDGFHRIQALYDKWNFWIIFSAGFTPIPFKLFTITAGAFNIYFPMFVLASIISRSARFFLVASLIYIFGEPIRDFIDRYFNWLAIFFSVLLIGGFVAVKYLV
jgi:membrane protein YqaA with SNARE-associated domain